MTPEKDSAAGGDTTVEASEQAHFRRTLIRVMAVQIAALLALAILQRHYTP
jgi:hypothetical protein